MAGMVDTERVILEVRLRQCLWNPRVDSYKNRDAKAQAWVDVCEAAAPSYIDSSNAEKIRIEKAVQLRWKTARDAYIRCRSKKMGPNNKKKYIFYDLMTYLEDIKDFDSNEEYSTNNEPSTPAAPTTATTATVAITTTAPTAIRATIATVAITTTAATATRATIATATITTTATSTEPHQSDEANDTSRSTLPLPKKKKRTAMTEFESQLLTVLKDNSTVTENPMVLREDDQNFFSSLAPIINEFDVNKKLLFRTRIIELAMQINAISQSTQGIIPEEWQ